MINYKILKQNHVKVELFQEIILKIGVQNLKNLKASHLVMRNQIFKKLLNIKVINNL